MGGNNRLPSSPAVIRKIKVKLPLKDGVEMPAICVLTTAPVYLARIEVHAVSPQLVLSHATRVTVHNQGMQGLLYLTVSIFLFARNASVNVSLKQALQVSTSDISRYTYNLFPNSQR